MGNQKCLLENYAARVCQMQDWCFQSAHATLLHVCALDRSSLCVSGLSIIEMSLVVTLKFKQLGSASTSRDRSTNWQLPCPFSLKFASAEFSLCNLIPVLTSPIHSPIPASHHMNPQSVSVQQKNGVYVLGGCCNLDRNCPSAAHIAKAWPPACGTPGTVWNLQKVHSIGGSWNIRDVFILVTLRGTVAYGLLCYHRHKANGPNHCGLKSQRPWAKKNPFYFFSVYNFFIFCFFVFITFFN